MAEMTCNLAETKPDSSDGRWGDIDIAQGPHSLTVLHSVSDFHVIIYIPRTLALAFESMSFLEPHSKNRRANPVRLLSPVTRTSI